jgi:hypothetical protein
MIGQEMKNGSIRTNRQERTAMNLSHYTFALAILAVSTMAPGQTDTAGQTDTTFTYQGQLSTADGPVNDSADFQFRLFGSEVGGVQTGPELLIEDVSVTEGLFSVELDFGVAALGSAAGGRWLEIAVRSPAGSGAFTTLSPRTVIYAAPFSVQTRGIYVADNGKVGIGTTAPGTAIGNSKLDVFGGHIAVQNNFGIFSVAQSGTGIGAGFDTTADDELSLFANGGERMRIADDGRIGIGTSNPLDHLHVAGVIRTDAGVRFSDGSFLSRAPKTYEIDFASFNIPDNGWITFEILIPNAEVGDCVIVNPPYDMRDNDYIAWCYVSEPAIVRLRLGNPSGHMASTSYSANTWRITVIK